MCVALTTRAWGGVRGAVQCSYLAIAWGSNLHMTSRYNITIERPDVAYASKTASSASSCKVWFSSHGMLSAYKNTQHTHTKAIRALR